MVVGVVAGVAGAVVKEVVYRSEGALEEAGVPGVRGSDGRPGVAAAAEQVKNAPVEKVEAERWASLEVEGVGVG